LRSASLHVGSETRLVCASRRSGTSKPRRRSIVASDADRWEWARELPSDELGFAPFNVMAVFPTLPAAEEAAADLRTAGLGERDVSIRTRTMTDDPGPSRVAPAVEAPATRRDTQVADKILTKVVVLAGVAGAAAALIAFLIALALRMSGTSIAIITVVAAVAGSVLGAAGGGALGSMTEAQKEEAAGCGCAATVGPLPRTPSEPFG